MNLNSPISFYVQVVFDMGLLGLLTYVGLLLGILIKYLRHFATDLKGNSVLLALLVSFMVVCYSDNMLFYLSYCWYLWLFLGGGCAYLEFRLKKV